MEPSNLERSSHPDANMYTCIKISYGVPCISIKIHLKEREILQSYKGVASESSTFDLQEHVLYCSGQEANLPPEPTGEAL